jgi:hypothetical protein
MQQHRKARRALDQGADRRAAKAQDEVSLRNPAQRGHRFQRKADSIPVIADSR